MVASYRLIGDSHRVILIAALRKQSRGDVVAVLCRRATHDYQPNTDKFSMA